MAAAGLYELLLDYADIEVEVEEVVLGLNWTLCRAGSSGLAATPREDFSRAGWELPLRGRRLGELSRWLLEWRRDQAAIGLAAVNAAINREADLVTQHGAIFQGRHALRHGFEWFAPQLEGKRVALIGAATQLLSTTLGRCELLRLQQRDGGLHPACDSKLPHCDWCFINSDTIADKTLPRLLELAAGATVVLYGASLPWLEEWQQFGVDYLLGCEFNAPARLRTTVLEGGDVEGDAEALHYRLIALQRPLTTTLPIALRHAIPA